MRSLRAALGNHPSRFAPPNPPQRLRVDHDHGDDVTGTPVYETDIRRPGYLEDVWKILSSPRAKSSSDRSDNKIATSMAQYGHDEGWVWGDVATNQFTKHAREKDYGWGLWADVFGMEDQGWKYLNIMTWARFHAVGLGDDEHQVGPILFDGTEEDWQVSAEGNWLLGKMVFDGMWWRPAFRGTNMPVYAETRPGSITYESLEPLHDDHCPIFRDPRAYIKLTPSFKVWTVNDTDGKVNVHKVAACNRDDINGLWDFMAVLDWHTADIMGWHDNWLDRMYATGGASGIGYIGDWVTAVDNWAAAVDGLFQCLQALHAPACNAQMATEIATVAVEQSTASLLLGNFPYTIACPVPSPGRPAHQGDYNDPSMLECQQIKDDGGR